MIQNFNPNEIQKLQSHVKQMQRILILIHANPDGDAIGSGIGLYQVLQKKSFQKIDLACIDILPEKLQWVDPYKILKNDFVASDYDTIIFLDCGDKNLTQFHTKKPEILSNKYTKIVIDHHQSNDAFGDINIIETDFCSTSEIIYVLLNQYLDIDISAEVATILLFGMYTDTGGFQHQNTTPRAYHHAGKLMEQGAKTEKIREFFKSHSLKQLRLWGEVLSSVTLDKEGAAIVGISQKSYTDQGLTREDLGGVIDFVNSMKEARYSILLSEDNKGGVKASLRTRKEDIDVNTIAKKYGGGGHIKAAGFSIPNSQLQKDIHWNIINH